MSKINKEKAVFIVFFIFVLLLGLTIITQVNTINQAREPKVGGLFVEFENGTSETEVKAVLEKFNMDVNNNTIDYNSDTVRSRYYIKTDKDKKMDVVNELRNEQNWTSEIEKGNHTVITFSEEFSPDESFLRMLEKNNIELKKSIWCYIQFRNGSNYWILENDAVKIKNELEINERVLMINFDYLKY